MSQLSSFVVEASEVGPTLVCRQHNGWWMKLDGQRLDAINRAAREHLRTHTITDPHPMPEKD